MTKTHPTIVVDSEILLRCVQTALEATGNYHNEAAATRFMQGTRVDIDDIPTMVNLIGMFQETAAKRGEDSSSDAAIRQLLRQQKDTVLEMIRLLKKSVDAMMPDDESLEYWLNDDYFPFVPSDEACAAYDGWKITRDEIDQAINGLIDGVCMMQAVVESGLVK